MTDRMHNPRILRPKSAPTAVSVTTSAISVLAENKRRGVALIQNVDAAIDIYLGRDNTVTSSNGIRLAAGQTLTDTFSTDAWFAIAASGTVSVRVLES